ncbi:MAG: 4a-hydroxytetrahydrobiopterin dehydratase [Massilia sp.]
MNLVDQQCQHQVTPLAPDAMAALLPQVPAWALVEGKLQRRFALRNYHETIAFVNALAWMVHQQDHHPELTVSYKECVATFYTHSVGGDLSLNDFICAARADAIYAERTGA